MEVCRIILTLLVFLAVSPWLAAQPMPPGAPPPATFALPNAPPVAGGPPFLQSAPVIQPPAPIVPLPSQTPGSIFGPPMAPSGPEQLPLPPGAATTPVIVAPGAPGPVVMPGPPSTIVVPVVDDDLAWDQIADVVSDYFTIAREQRARRGEVLCEGRIETAPQDGATVLEPHRKDSVGWFNRWESTFQSIRRRAMIRVMPEANGYLVEVIVEKELEDVPKPEKATAGAAVFRTDFSLPSSRLEEVSRTRQSPCWISLGRDCELEQLMLAEIHARLNGITGNRVSAFR